MPVDADMDAIDRMMNLLSDSDVGDNTIRQGGYLKIANKYLFKKKTPFLLPIYELLYCDK